ncbi:MAG: site-2 protease family protein [Gammaproteobacteria bacterium]|nr:site-2 protease family protein [Gammaproteobacteria bacterium]
MLPLLFQGEFALFALIVIALVISLSFHEFGHAFVAKRFGDDTAERAGRLTVNPIAHIDPVGLFMVVAIGIGYAKPVPTDPRNFTSRFADLWVAAAGPFMNLVVAAAVLNVFVLLVKLGFGAVGTDGVQVFVAYLVGINLVLMVFNLIPLGPLDGHYILPYFLPRQLARKYVQFNARYGALALLGLILLQFVGLPVFQTVMAVARFIEPFILLV